MYTYSDIIMAMTMVAYLALVIGVGIRYSKKNSNVDDFYLGGRQLGPLVTAMSAEASDMSSWLLLGLPGVAYLSGVADAGWTAIGLALGTYVNWFIVSKRLRVYSHKINAITIPDFFKNRYRDDSNVLLGISAVVIIVFFVPYTASGFAACGKLFSSLFGMNYLTAMIVCATCIMVYTLMGGFLAASTTDFIQSIVMTIALIAILVFGISSAGGWDNVVANANSLPGYLGLTQLHDAQTGEALPYGVLTIVSTLAWGLGYFGMPHILLRFMAIEDENRLKLSRRIATVWVIISMTIAIIIGIVGNALSAGGVVNVLEGSDSETIIVRITGVLSALGPIPAIIAGVVIAGILASTMSTSDSQLLAASSSFSQNLCRGVFKVKMSEKTALIVARLSVLGISVIAVFLASDPDSSVFQIVSFAWAGFGAAFGPVMLTALFWKRSNRQGATAGMLVGGIMIFVWKFLVRPLGGAWDIYELLPAFICALAAIIIVSLATPAPAKEITDEFEGVRS